MIKDNTSIEYKEVSQKDVPTVTQSLMKRPESWRKQKTDSIYRDTPLFTTIKEEDIKNWRCSCLFAEKAHSFLIGFPFVFGWVFTSLCVCLISGIWLVTYESSQMSVRYDNINDCNQTKMPSKCSFKITIDQKFSSSRIVFYYELRNFFSNHRRFLNSRGEGQLKGVDPDPALAGDIVLNTISQCDLLSEWNGRKLYPCGLIGGSFFSDRFAVSLTRKGGATQNLCPNCTEPSSSESWKDRWYEFYDDNFFSKSGLAWDTDSKKI